MSSEQSSRDLAERIKRVKPFTVKDLIVYAVVLIILGIGFTLLFTFPKTDGEGFYVYIRGERAFTYYYGGEYGVENAFTDKISVDAENATVTIYFNEQKTEYNVLSVDSANKKVKVIKSTCENHDCELMENEIVCAPHFLKITQIKATGDITVG